MEEPGEILYIDETDQPFYDEITVFPARGDGHLLTNTEKFLLAVAYGFKNNVEKEIKKRVGGGFLRRSYLQPQDLALLDAVAVARAKGDLSVILNQAEVLQTAQRLAHGGALLAQSENEFRKGYWIDKLEESIFKSLEGKDEYCDKTQGATG